MTSIYRNRPPLRTPPPYKFKLNSKKFTGRIKITSETYKKWFKTHEKMVILMEYVISRDKIRIEDDSIISANIVTSEWFPASEKDIIKYIDDNTFEIVVE